MSSFAKRFFLGVLTFGFTISSIYAQVNLSTSTYSQDFNTLASSSTSSSLPTGWLMLETGSSADLTYGTSTGSSNSGNTYSFGTASNAERALGGLQSGSVNPTVGASFKNITGAKIASLVISYTGEQWRLGALNREDRLDFSYSTTSTSLANGTWIDVNALDFVAPITTGTTGALDGNLTANKTSISYTITGLNIAAGDTVWIKWSDFNATGSDDGLAVDDFSITPILADPSVSLTPNTIINLNYVVGNGPSAAQTYTLSGTNLSPENGNLTLTAPANFEISNTSASSGFSDILTQAYLGRSLDTLIYVRLKSGLSIDSYTGNIVHSGGGLLSSASVSLSGIVSSVALPNISIADFSANEGNTGTTTFTFLVSLSSPAGVGGVSFDIATAGNGSTSPSDFTPKSLTNQTIAEGNSTYEFYVNVNGDTYYEDDETFLVNISNVSNAAVVDDQAVGTILNDDSRPITKIHTIQGAGSATTMSGFLTVEGIVTGNYQFPGGSGQIRGFFVQEETTDIDSDPATSEGLFIYCGTCATVVSEGQKVEVSGYVSEYNTVTQISSVEIIIKDAGNHLSEITPATIDLPIVGDINTYYEAFESMVVQFADVLTLSEYFELSRFGQIELFEGDRPKQFTEENSPSSVGYAAHIESLNRRRVILDDGNNTPNSSVTTPDGYQAEFFPATNGGFSAGTQGVDFFRGGDQVSNLRGVLNWSYSGFGSADAWRVRPLNAYPAIFTAVNPRPETAPIVGGDIKAASVNMLNYFTTIDLTSSSTSGPCGPNADLDCRGADSNAELARQRERATQALCGLNADVFALMEVENTNLTAINDIVSSINTTCGIGNPFATVDIGGTSLGTDAIRVALVYKTGTLAPVGSAMIDLNSIHSRPPLAQTFEVIDVNNPSFGQRFTVVANHFKSKGTSGATGLDMDQSDGQGGYNQKRVNQANRLITWVNTEVLPTANDPDVLLLGDFNSYAKEDPVVALNSAGYIDLESALIGPSAYSYVFDAQIGHLDYAFANPSMAQYITGIAPWHINADESPLFDYNDDIKDVGEDAYEEKPNGSLLTPARTLFQSGTPFRASDHDPILVGFSFACGQNLVFESQNINNQKASVSITGKTANNIPSGSVVKYRAGNFVSLEPGFVAENGTVFTAEIGGCEN
jgi:predicted extracellular nuclease